MKTSKQVIETLLNSAGITINGDKPYDIQVHDEGVYSRILREGSLGLGEAYMDGSWDCESLDQFFYKVLSANLDGKIKKNLSMLLPIVLNFFLNAGRKSKAFEVGEKHYDIGNDLYEAMLGDRMVYTCGYWNKAKNLDEAQEAKLDLVCRKIGLKKGQKILDIGSGWGSFISFAAEKYEVNAVGVTVSKEQKALADEKFKKLSVETRLQDYRDINDKFNHVVSLGMFEHVNSKNYRSFMKIVHRALEDKGLFLLHTIGRNDSSNTSEPWISKYFSQTLCSLH